ncbi:MAG: Na+/H+ antiporter subunit E [Acidimicrobiia bacterium]|nr:Na+/H+ antiporter subunit E [Acidimicrobiia bacterium]MDX2466696.1 Na+/H+ antiporter subunit E [Acidimicrobiia bacterium]
MSPFEILGSGVMATGMALSVLAAWGVLDFPSALSRMHAATKSASLGLALIAFGAGLAAESPGLVGISVLVAAFLFMTAPISGHMLGTAVYSAGQAGELIHDDLAGSSQRTLQLSDGKRAGFSPVRVLVLMGIWVLLWRDSSPGVWVGGLAVAVAIETVRRTIESPVRIRVPSLVRFFAHYVWVVVLSNLRVAWEVVTPNNDQISEAIVAVPLRTESIPAALLVANAFSFTPGSLTIDLTEGPLVLYVHVLHFESVATVRADVAKLEDLVVAAVAQPERE